jgi:hypothetical protein
MMSSGSRVPFRSSIVVLCFLILAAGSVPNGGDPGVVNAAPCGSLGGIPCGAAGPAGVEEGLKPPDSWALAVVYERQGEKRVLLGSVASPVVILSPRTPAGTEAGAGEAMRRASHEIWLLKDGATRGIWYSREEALYGALPGADFVELSADDGTLGEVVRSAALPPVTGGERQVDETAHAFPAGDARYPLSELCGNSDVIAIGRVVGILREAFTPTNAHGPQQHTVYALAVQQYLKAHADVLSPVLKVYQMGGYLPYVFRPADDLEHRGVGFRIEDDPMLLVGADYCLFLRLPRVPDRSRGYVFGRTGGFSGKIAELDEYVPTAPWRGKVLLRDGYTWSPDGDGAPLTRPLPEAKQVREGPEILGRPIREAVRLIQEALAASEG